MGALQKFLADANRDIIDWQTDMLSCSEFGPEILRPIVDKYYNEAAAKFFGEASDFEQFVVKYIRLRISKYKLSSGESISWSAEKMDGIISVESEECDDDYMVA